jgi:hypothetical protein
VTAPAERLASRRQACDPTRDPWPTSIVGAHPGKATLAEPHGLAAPAGSPARSPLEELCDAITTSARQLGEQLVPVYLMYRDALDRAGVAVSGEKLLHELAGLLGLRDALDHEPTPTNDGVVTATRTTITATLDRVTMATAPIVFRGTSLPAPPPSPLSAVTTPVALQQAIGEVHETLGLLEVLDYARPAFVDGKPPPAERLKELRGRVREAARRPVDWLFLRAALGSMWGPLDTATDTEPSLSDSLARASAEATTTGWYADLHGFDLGQAISDITMGTPEPVLEMLAPRDPETRARLLEQLDGAGFLDPLIHQLSWKAVKEALYDHLPDSGHDALKAKLEPIFAGETGEEMSLTHFTDQVGWPWDMSFKPLLNPTLEDDDRLRDARARGDISDASFERRRRHLLARSVITTAASFVLAYGASKAFSLAEDALGIAVEVPAGAAAAAGGGLVGGGVRLVSDVYNICVSGDQTELSSLTEYAQDVAAGVAGGLLGSPTEGSEPGSSRSETSPAPNQSGDDTTPGAQAEPDKTEPQHEAQPARTEVGGGDVAAQAGYPDLANIASQRATAAIKNYKFDEPDGAAARQAATADAEAAGDAAYQKAIAEGATAKSARYKAKQKASEVALASAKELARADARRHAERAIEDGSVFDASKLDALATEQLARFAKGEIGANARRLAPLVSDMPEKAFLELMDRETSANNATKKDVMLDATAKKPAQLMTVWEYLDGTTVRYKPLGGPRQDYPTVSIEVKKDPSLPDMHLSDEAFKVTADGRPVPVNQEQIENPYNAKPHGDQFEAFEDRVLGPVHFGLR